MEEAKRLDFLKQILTGAEYRQIEKNKEWLKQSLEMYSKPRIDSVLIVSIDNKRFLIEKEEVPKLHKDWLMTLQKVSKDNGLQNPVYVHVGENGELGIE